MHIEVNTIKYYVLKSMKLKFYDKVALKNLFPSPQEFRLIPLILYYANRDQVAVAQLNTVITFLIYH